MSGGFLCTRELDFVKIDDLEKLTIVRVFGSKMIPKSSLWHPLGDTLASHGRFGEGIKSPKDGLRRLREPISEDFGRRRDLIFSDLGCFRATI